MAFEELEKRSLCEFRAIRTLRLVRLYGPSMGRIGASAGVTSGSDYAVSQHWSKAIYDQPAMVDGILYLATYDNDQLAAVLFDRAQDALDDGKSASFTSDLQLLGRILDHYGASTR